MSFLTNQREEMLDLTTSSVVVEFHFRTLQSQSNQEYRTLGKSQQDHKQTTNTLQAIQGPWSLFGQTKIRHGWEGRCNRECPLCDILSE